METGKKGCQAKCFQCIECVYFQTHLLNYVYMLCDVIYKPHTFCILFMFPNIKVV